ncbi:MAG: Rrf2 family transcriptional regulator [Chloroflexi bacterium]|nr:Rrf2 family transcriptional regulator [Chloroflexota bacterium]
MFPAPESPRAGRERPVSHNLDGFGQEWRRALFAINSHARYGVAALVDLAQHGNREFVRAQDIAERKGVPPSILGQVLSSLVRSGLVRSRRGANGGYQLAVASTGLTLDRILFELGMEPPGGGCIGIERAEQAALAAMRQTSLADLAMQSASDLTGYQI